jgi:ferredoxin
LQIAAAMANSKRALKENVDGDFFVNSTCLNGAVSRSYAPGIFRDMDRYAFVTNQPQGDAEELAAKRALLACPAGSIRIRNKDDPRAAIDSFPLLIASPVYINIINHRKSYSAHSYFIKADPGNWLIDSPPYTST